MSGQKRALRQEPYAPTRRACYRGKVARGGIEAVILRELCTQVRRGRGQEFSNAAALLEHDLIDERAGLGDHVELGGLEVFDVRLLSGADPRVLGVTLEEPLQRLCAGRRPQELFREYTEIAEVI